MARAEFQIQSPSIPQPAALEEWPAEAGRPRLLAARAAPRAAACRQVLAVHLLPRPLPELARLLEYVLEKAPFPRSSCATQALAPIIATPLATAGARIRPYFEHSHKSSGRPEAHLSKDTRKHSSFFVSLEKVRLPNSRHKCSGPDTPRRV